MLLANTWNGEFFQKRKLSITWIVYYSADTTQIIMKEKMEKSTPVKFKAFLAFSNEIVTVSTFTSFGFFCLFFILFSLLSLKYVYNEISWLMKTINLGFFFHREYTIWGGLFLKGNFKKLFCKAILFLFLWASQFTLVVSN